MADEFKNRKDIEILYDLVYNRTTGSPVTQKNEFDAFKNTVMNDYASKDYVSTVTEPLVNSLDGYVESANETIASIEENISDIQDSISTLRSDIDAISSKVNDTWHELINTQQITVAYRNRTVRVVLHYPSQIFLPSNTDTELADMSLSGVPSTYFPFTRVITVHEDIEYSILSNGKIMAWTSGMGKNIQPNLMIEYEF